jgi:hypothetical protein
VSSFADKLRRRASPAVEQVVNDSQVSESKRETSPLPEPKKRLSPVVETKKAVSSDIKKRVSPVKR